MKLAATSILSLSLLSLFAFMTLALANYELDALQYKINAEYPDKLVAFVDNIVPAQYSSTSLSDVRALCELRSSNNMSVSSLLANSTPIPITDSDADKVCEEATKAADMPSFKRNIISYKLASIVDDAFSNIRKDYAGPYTSTYMPISFVAALGLFVLSAGLFYFASKGVTDWLKIVSFHTCIHLALALFAIGVLYFTLPNVIQSAITSNPNLSSVMDYLQTAEQKAAGELLLSQTVLLITDWMQSVMLHMAAIYAVLIVITGGAWILISTAERISKANESKGQRQPPKSPQTDVYGRPLEGPEEVAKK